MSGCHHTHAFDGVSPAYKRALVAVIAINGLMFGVEMTAGFSAGSEALKADALDFAGDALTYTISLAVIGHSLRYRAQAALFKGVLLSLTAMGVLGLALADLLAAQPPVGSTMGLVGALALIANLASVVILMRWRDGDANIRSVWLCSRNDAIGNVGVMIAGLLVVLLNSHWPDFLMALAMAGLFLRSSISIIAQARRELAADGEVEA